MEALICAPIWSACPPATTIKLNINSTYENQCSHLQAAVGDEYSAAAPTYVLTRRRCRLIHVRKLDVYQPDPSAWSTWATVKCHTLWRSGCSFYVSVRHATDLHTRALLLIIKMEFNQAKFIIIILVFLLIN
jgi:hypothetical protein